MPKLIVHAICAGAIALGGIGCGKNGSPDRDLGKSEGRGESPAKGPAPANLKVPLKRVTNRKENREGVVFIAEYHHIRQGKTTMERSPEDFKADLERMYKLGFRPINISEYLSGKFELPPGASPVVLTFDDGNPSQVQMLPNGDLDPKSGLGILKAFSDAHPDFPPKAVFFVLPQMWGQPEFQKKKVELIQSWGGEIANHTVTHPNLSKISDAKVREEIGGAFKLLEPLKGHPEYLALPLGISPKNKALLKELNLKAVFLVGANPAPPSTSPKFDPFRIPRIQACEGDYGLGYWLDKLEKGQVKPYVAP